MADEPARVPGAAAHDWGDRSCRSADLDPSVAATVAGAAAVASGMGPAVAQ
jgi:hypothetical protein